jgi:hypothetical protein
LDRAEHAGTYYLLERWFDQAALDEHFKATHMYRAAADYLADKQWARAERRGLHAHNCAASSDYRPAGPLFCHNPAAPRDSVYRYPQRTLGDEH